MQPYKFYHCASLCAVHFYITISINIVIISIFILGYYILYIRCHYILCIIYIYFYISYIVVKRMQRNCGPIGNFTTCCTPLRIYRAIVDVLFFVIMIAM